MAIRFFYVNTDYPDKSIMCSLNFESEWCMMYITIFKGLSFNKTLIILVTLKEVLFYYLLYKTTAKFKVFTEVLNFNNHTLPVNIFNYITRLNCYVK